MVQLSPLLYRILFALRDPLGLSLEALAEATGIGSKRLTYGGYMSVLRQLKLIHIGGWQRSDDGGFQPVYRPGPGEDLPRPKVRLLDLNSAGVRLIEQALKVQGPMGYRELAGVTGLACSTLKNGGYLDALLVQRRIYIQRWERNQRGRMRAIYAAGNGPQAEPLPPFSGAEKSRRHRQRKQAAEANQTDFSTLPRPSFCKVLFTSHTHLTG